MPPKKKQAAPSLPARTLILDNGAYSIKAGFAVADQEPDLSSDCHIIPNALGKGTNSRNQPVVFVGDELNACTDFGQMSFRRPMEKGYIIGWDTQLDIWKQAVFDQKAKLHCDPHETNLILTESPNCPLALQSNTDQIIFEECEFTSAYRCLGSTLNAYNDIASLMGDPPLDPAGPAECFMHVDVGYSHTTVTPVYRGHPLKSATRRLDVAGKLLTNHLTHLLSLQHYDLSAEPYMVTQIKEDVCYVARDAAAFRAGLETTWHGNPRVSKSSSSNDIVLDYVLPNWRTTTRGRARPHDASLTPAQRMAADRARKERNEPIEQFFPVASERFAVPELLFAPSDIGLQQAGLPEVIVQSLATLPAGMWAGMLANVVVVGGTALLKGFVERLEDELRSLAPSQCVVRVRRPDDAVQWTWNGGARLARLDGGAELRKMSITKAEYDEFGSTWATRRFNGTEKK